MTTLTQDKLSEREVTPDLFPASYLAAAAATTSANVNTFKIQNVLVSINSLNSSQTALKTARWFAEQSGARITILYAVTSDSSAPGPQELQEEITRSAGIKSTQLRAVLIRPGVTNDSPIKEAARDEAADLIIIPANFHWGSNHFWKADPMERLMRHISCPLLIVDTNGTQAVPVNGQK